MPSVVITKSSRPEKPPITRAVFRPWVVLLLLALCRAAPLMAADHRAEEPIHRFHLMADLSGNVDPSGGLVFQRQIVCRSPQPRPELVWRQRIPAIVCLEKQGVDYF